MGPGEITQLADRHRGYSERRFRRCLSLADRRVRCSAPQTELGIIGEASGLCIGGMCARSLAALLRRPDSIWVGRGRFMPWRWFGMADRPFFLFTRARIGSW